MKRQCNLDLGLVTPSVFYHSSRPNKKQPQPLTIFYNGQVAACDVTEVEARAIILCATKQQFMEHKSRISPSSPATGLSMKRSLQRFLEKRKTRAHAISPY